MSRIALSKLVDTLTKTIKDYDRRPGFVPTLAPVQKASADDLAALQRLADRLEPRLRQEFLQAIEQIQDQVQLERVAEAYMSGHVTQIETELQIGELTRYQPALQETLRTGFLHGAATAEDFLDGTSLGLSLSLVHHAAVAYAAEQAAELVTLTNEDARDAIRLVVANAIERGDHPLTAARLLRDVVGLNARQGEAVDTFYANRIDAGDELDEALARTDRYAVKSLRYRAKMIARTEMIRSLNAGQGAYHDQARQHGVLNEDVTFRQWIVGPNPCEICEPMDGAEVGLDEPWETEDGPIDLDGDSPHPNCMCTYGLVFHREEEGGDEGEPDQSDQGDEEEE